MIANTFQKHCTTDPRPIIPLFRPNITLKRQVDLLLVVIKLTGIVRTCKTYCTQSQASDCCKKETEVDVNMDVSTYG
jgi:hypothetical protein